ncbi:hypothetical protein O9929_10620 [Vibrio lentus]|nr:hypothetical protein [Vibrio lentus]
MRVTADAGVVADDGRPFFIKKSLKSAVVSSAVLKSLPRLVFPSTTAHQQRRIIPVVASTTQVLGDELTSSNQADYFIVVLPVSTACRHALRPSAQHEAGIRKSPPLAAIKSSAAETASIG